MLGLFLPTMAHMGLKQPMIPSNQPVLDSPGAPGSSPGWGKGTLKVTWEGERTAPSLVSSSSLAGLRVRGLSSSR